MLCLGGGMKNLKEEEKRKEHGIWQGTTLKPWLFPARRHQTQLCSLHAWLGAKEEKKREQKKIHGLPLGIEPRTTSRASAARHGIAATEWQVRKRGKQPILTCQETGAEPETIQQVYNPKNRAHPSPRWCSSVVRASD